MTGRNYVLSSDSDVHGCKIGKNYSPGRYSVERNKESDLETGPLCNKHSIILIDYSHEATVRSWEPYSDTVESIIDSILITLYCQDRCNEARYQDKTCGIEK